MALDDLLDRLRRETDEQVSALLTAAQRDAERIASDWSVAADQEQAGRLNRLHIEHRGLLARGAESARRDGMLSLLEARRSAIARVFERVGHLLAGATGTATYLTTIGADLDHAMSVQGDSPAVLQADPVLAAWARDHLPTAPGIVVDPELHGFRLRSTDGRLEIDGSLEERLRRLAPSLSIEVVRALEEAT